MTGFLTATALTAALLIVPTLLVGLRVLPGDAERGAPVLWLAVIVFEVLLCGGIAVAALLTMLEGASGQQGRTWGVVMLWALVVALVVLIALLVLVAVPSARAAMDDGSAIGIVAGVVLLPLLVLMLVVLGQSLGG